MSQFDSFIFFDEVVIITILYFLVCILFCVYLSPYFLKGRIIFLQDVLHFKFKRIIKIYYNKMHLMLLFFLLYNIFLLIVLLIIIFISMYLFATFYSDLCFYTVYYFFIIFIFFISVVYSLYKLIKICWKKDFVTFTKIVNSLSYGVIFAMYIFIFYAFGEVGVILFLLGKALVYSYFEKITLIIKRETNTYEQSFIAMLASAVNFLAYTLFMFLWEKQFTIIIIFYVKMLLLLLFMISIYFFVIEFKKWYTFIDTIEFCKNHPGHALTLLIYMARMFSIVVGEVVCMRYGIPGGLLLMGGPGMIPSGNGKPPSSDDLSEEELAALEKTLRNNSPVVEHPKVLIAYENTLPDAPSKDANKFLEDMTVNVEAFEGLQKTKQYLEYAKQYKIHREENPDLITFFHKDFKEFLSCIRSMIVNCSDENGKVKTFALPVEDKSIDYIIDRVGFQSKIVGKFSSGDLERNRKKYAEFIEDFDNINFRNQIIYNDIERPEDMKRCIQENPDFLRGQEMLKKNTFPPVGKSWVRDYFVTVTKNAEIMREKHIELKKDGFIAGMTQTGKTAGIQEIEIAKSMNRPGCSKFFRTIKKGIKF